MNTQKKAAQKLWAENKYLVLSKSQKIYKEIREYLKKDTANPDELKLLIDNALKLDENKSEIINTLQHIWGYFKNSADEDEKTHFFYLMSRYKENKIYKNEVLSYLSTLLKKYPNKYLEASTIFNKTEENNAVMA
ncbi:YbgA family protein [Treponema sp. OMZ 799]|uniref:YbgA family protein n=1 Tax=Treponema sp. OMZ 799 TaxID=2563668 RepID=UPI0020A3EBFD|nr:YbgA family protein [Treponema sp. OMZ 799]UTC78811.1 YbgA family protein [Treponema sp. OMZ 799]